MEEKPSISKEENEWHPNQHQICSEEWDDCKEDHDSQINEESMNEFWVVDWGIAYAYKYPIVSQNHKNELRKEVLESVTRFGLHNDL